MAEISGGHLVARALKQEGVEYIFGLPGGQIDAIFQGCKDEGIKLIDTRHEQAAVFMAEGWSWLTCKPGIAVATAGPGVTNAVTGIWNAQGKGSPLICFGGKAPISAFDMGALQDMDSLALVKTVTKWAGSGYETKRVAEYVSMAYRHTLSGRPGPVYLEFPQNVLDAKIDDSEVTMPQNYRSMARPQGDPTLVKEAVEMLLKAERPLIHIGAGVWWSQVEDELKNFIEMTKIPVSGGQWGVRGDHPLRLVARGISQQADVVLVLGTRIDYRLRYGRAPMFNENCKWIQVDIEPTEIGRNRPVDIGITGDIKAVLGQMIEEIGDRCKGRKELPWIDECREQAKRQHEQYEPLMNSDNSPVHPARLCREVRDFIDDDATIIVDGGEISMWSFTIIRNHEPAHILGIMPTGTIGIGSSYAMAAKLARPDKQVLLISGDGSFGMNAMEFDSMVRHNIPVVAIISNDSGWGAIVHMQEAKGLDRVVGTELGFVRYDKVVEALGGYGEMVDKPDEIRPALERAFASGKPACVNVMCDSLRGGGPIFPR